jgi:hypothetical protein
MCVAENSGFWSYIDASKRAGRNVGTEEKGFFSWKLSIQFLDQSGAPALIENETSVVTADAHEFYRNAGEARKEESAVTVVAELLKTVAETQRDMQRSLADCAKEVAVQVANSVMKPLTDMADRVVAMSKEETGRADVMTKAAMQGIREAQPQPDIFDGLAKVIPAGAMALKAIKDLKN